jgi:hypothetical protein
MIQTEFIPNILTSRRLDWRPTRISPLDTTAFLALYFPDLGFSLATRHWLGEVAVCTNLIANLIEGLAYLRELPAAQSSLKNIGYTDNARLRVIYFGTVIRVGSEDGVVEGVYGTRG